MALFLNESLNENDNFNNSFEEAYEGLIQASLDMQELTENLLIEDFLLNEECKILTEKIGSEKKNNFLISAIKRIIEFIKNVRQKIINFFTNLSNNLRIFWNKLTGKQTTSKVEVFLGGLSNAVILMSILKEMQALRNTPTTQTKFKVNSLFKKFNDVLSKAKKKILVNKNNKKTETKAISAIDIFLNPKHTMNIFFSSKANLNKAENIAKQAESVKDSKKANIAKDLTSIELKITATIGRLTSFVKESISNYA